MDFLLGPKSYPDPKTDLVLKFHSTTSNTSIIFCCHPQDTFAFPLVAFLRTEYQKIGVARSGIAVEVGRISLSMSNSVLYGNFLSRFCTYAPQSRLDCSKLSTTYPQDAA